MTVAKRAELRRSLVYATPGSLRRAEELGVDGPPVLEVRVARALDAGRVRERRDGRFTVDVAEGLYAVVARAGETGQGLLRWRVTEVFANRRLRRQLRRRPSTGGETEEHMNSQDATTRRPSKDAVFPDEAAKLVDAADTLKAALGVTLEVADFADRLARPERSRLLHLTRLLRTAPEPGVPQVPSPDERAAAEAFADGVESLPTTSERRRHEQQLTAELARRLGFIPTGAERAALRGAKAGATLDTLAGRLAAAAPERRSQAATWAALGEGEQEELEALVEQALADPGLFRARREDHAAGLKLELLARRAAEPAPMQSWPASGVVLPERLLDDLAACRVHVVDVGILVAVALTFATRRIDPRQERYLAWQDGGATLVVARGLHRLLPYWSDEIGPGTDIAAYWHQDCERRLAASGWLSIQEAERGLLRVKLGKRFKPAR